MESEKLRKLAEDGIEIPNEVEAREVLREYDISCPPEVMAEYEKGKKGEDYLKDLKREGLLEYPLYLKIVSRDITSKTDANAIERVSSDGEAEKAIDRIISNAREYDRKAEIQGILASKDVSNETREIILGSTLNNQFGHVISLGFGGIYVEVYRDVEFRVVPINEFDVYSMIDDLKGKKMFEEFRGMKPIDLDSLVETVMEFSQLIEENPEIEEMDVNPLLVGPEGSVAVDTMIRIST